MTEEERYYIPTEWDIVTAKQLSDNILRELIETEISENVRQLTLICCMIKFFHLNDFEEEDIDSTLKITKELWARIKPVKDLN